MKSKSQLFSSAANSRATKTKEVNGRIINLLMNQ